MDESNISDEPVVQGRESGNLSRRLLLRKAANSAPLVLTLGSGAALARSSNIINASNAPDEDGNFYCLETDFNYDGSGSYDVGMFPTQTIYRYPSDLTYRRDAGSSAVKLYGAETSGAMGAEVVTGFEVCEQGGVFYAGEDRYNVGNGGLLISSDAWTSVAGARTTIVDALMDS